ncbi:MAG: DUF1934 domain-containing protein [Clostridia bacterium]|jgi:uncharacterized beta-barrel protein YwiB (DUF1934 family)|nr:DUF1934 domain-containing protein [Clostridia bacterium]
MKNDAIIKFITVQTTEDNESDRLEIDAQGTYEKTENGYIIEYSEIDEEMEGSKTTISLDSPECVTITRTGNYNSQFTIEKNKRHSCHYNTPAGSLMMGVFANSVFNNLTDHGGKIKMKYTIDFNSNMVAENTVTVLVKTK